MTASAFSQDGSTLAVAAGSRVTLWDPDSCRLAAVLPLAPEHSALGLPIARLAFVPASPFLVACSEGFVVVWNLLTASLQWALDVPVASLAVDPVHASFAIAVPVPAERPPKATAAGSDKSAASASAVDSEDKASTSQQAAQHVSHVLVFDPRSPTPRYRSTCPGTLAPTLLYVTPGMPQHAQASRGLPALVSPILVLTEERSYAYLDAADQDSMPRQGAPKKAAEAASASAYEAAFGPLPAPDQVASAMDVDDTDALSSAPRWKQLFDAPSHALPPPTVLAQSFLRLVTTE